MAGQDRINRSAKVTADLAGARLDQAAVQLFDGFSRAELSRWIKSGELLVDGQTAQPKRRLLGDELLQLAGETRQLPDWQTPEDIPLDCLFEDDHVIVINKPAGLVVHPGAGQPDGTLLNGLLHRRPEQRSLPRAGIVHRLDKDTSGLLVVATSPTAHAALTADLKSHSVERVYTAVLEGTLTGGMDIEQPIGRHPTVRTRQAVRPDGKYALTHVRLGERYVAHTLVRAQLETGRTHQIRVHLAGVGSPLVGDTRYGAKRLLPAGCTQELAHCLQQFPRQALHARELAFKHPISGEQMRFEAQLPADMAELIELLRAHTKSMAT